MAKENLDKMFQEQLKNLEVSPSKRAWNNIEAQLTKKKRKVFPFWWFIGAAASFLVLGLFFYPYYSNSNQNLNINSDEIITTIPEVKKEIKDGVENFNLNKKYENDVLISNEDTSLKIKKESSQFPNLNNTERVHQPKKTKKINTTFNLKPIAINCKIDIQNPLLSILINDNIKKTKQGLDIGKITKKDKRDKIPKNKKNWSVAPMFAVLQSNSLTDSSPINANLTTSTSGENSYSYGVQVAYKLNNRWSVQSGIHLQEINYANNKVVVNKSSGRNPFATEFSNGDSFSFNTTNTSPPSVASISEDIQFSRNFLSSATEFNSGNITQNYGYVEIPVEIKYNFSNNTKLQTQLVTGFSGLFLSKNQVTLDTQNFSRALKVSNLNNINFSGNLGFDFNYFFDKNWSFNLNPMFKLQLNTFSDDANGFAPFNLGLYTGIKYQF